MTGYAAGYSDSVYHHSAFSEDPMTCPFHCGMESENNELYSTPYGDGLVRAFHPLPQTAKVLYHTGQPISMGLTKKAWVCAN